MSNTVPKIYVACLASYNNGFLHGTWISIDLDKDEDEIWEEINQMLKDSPMPDAEEFAIHGFENFETIKINEFESIEEVVKLSEMIQNHGKAFAIYHNNTGDDWNEDDFLDRYRGVYESKEDFVYESWEQDGRIKELEKLGILDSYIDWSAIARDWFLSGDFYSYEASYQEVYVFANF